MKKLCFDPTLQIRSSPITLFDFYIEFLYVSNAFSSSRHAIDNPMAKETQDRSTSIKKKTVLIVEDSPGFSELMKFVVEDEDRKSVV